MIFQKGWTEMSGKKPRQMKGTGRTVTGRNGFTVIELAVVLVIIGLIVGMVVKGQVLITSGQMKQLFSQKKDITEAFYAYYERFVYYPGDDPNAAARFSGATNGNGNGLVGVGAGATAPNFACAGTGTEQCDLWFELRQANFLGGTGFGNPRHAFNGNIALTNNTVSATAGHWLAFQNVPFDGCQDLDRQYDDGAYNTGSIRGSADYGAATTGTFTLFFRL